MDRFRRFREMLKLCEGDERDQMPNIRDRRQTSTPARVCLGSKGTAISRMKGGRTPCISC
jgi:hypothetical protein